MIQLILTLIYQKIYTYQVKFSSTFLQKFLIFFSKSLLKQLIINNYLVSLYQSSSMLNIFVKQTHIQQTLIFEQSKRDINSQIYETTSFTITNSKIKGSECQLKKKEIFQEALQYKSKKQKETDNQRFQSKQQSFQENSRNDQNLSSNSCQNQNKLCYKNQTDQKQNKIHANQLSICSNLTGQQKQNVQSLVEIFLQIQGKLAQLLLNMQSIISDKQAIYDDDLQFKKLNQQKTLRDQYKNIKRALEQRKLDIRMKQNGIKKQISQKLKEHKVIREQILLQIAQFQQQMSSTIDSQQKHLQEIKQQQHSQSSNSLIEQEYEIIYQNQENSTEQCGSCQTDGKRQCEAKETYCLQNQQKQGQNQQAESDQQFEVQFLDNISFGEQMQQNRKQGHTKMIENSQIKLTEQQKGQVKIEIKQNICSKQGFKEEHQIIDDNVQHDKQDKNQHYRKCSDKDHNKYVIDLQLLIEQNNCQYY